MGIIGSGGTGDTTKCLYSFRYRESDGLLFLCSSPGAENISLINDEGLTNIVMIDNYNKLYALNGVEHSFPTKASGTSYKEYIFAYSAIGDVNYGFSFIGRIFYAKYWESGVLTHYFIPMKAKEAHTAYKGSTQTTCSINEVGMFDAVTEKFYINSGSGSFIAGPEV